MDLESLNHAQIHAADMLVEFYDEERHIPVRTSSHTDLWPGDRWPEAYLAIGARHTAVEVMGTIARSIRPSDGGFPHILQGSHKRFGMETRMVDRLAYIQQGNGITRLPNGEWVTRIFAPPTQALSAMAIVNSGLELPGEINTKSLTTSMNALWDARGYGPTGFLYTNKRDELTNSKGTLADEAHTSGQALDIAINTLFINNGKALTQLANHEGVTVDFTLQETLSMLQNRVARRLLNATSDMKDGKPLEREEILAIARLAHPSITLTNDMLRETYTPPPLDDTHNERTRLTMAECIEVARLTPYSEASRDYLERILPKIAEFGAAVMTRFEGVAPGKNALTNKYNRKQLWLPVAAEIVQISPGQL